MGFAHYERFLRDTSDLRRFVKALDWSAPRETIQILGKTGNINRDIMWFGEYDSSGRYPVYRTDKWSQRRLRPKNDDGLDEAKVPEPIPDFLRELCLKLSEEFGCRFNHVVIQRYLMSKDNISWHHDKDFDIKPGTHIVCLSLGSDRIFGVKNRHATRKMTVSDGDVVVFNTAFNKRHKHTIYPGKPGAAVRYSLSFRCIETMSKK
jgi:alkylated DNA repair dioxygenase AlkB